MIHSPDHLNAQIIEGKTFLRLPDMPEAYEEQETQILHLALLIQAERNGAPILVDSDTMLPIVEGSYVHLSRSGERARIDSIALPHKAGSTGRVHTNLGSFFPSVVNGKWIGRTDQ